MHFLFTMSSFFAYAVMRLRFIHAMVFCTFVTLVVLPMTCESHDVTSNRANIVLREGNHVSITFYVSFSVLMHKCLAPELNYSEFILQFSALSSEDFGKQINQLQKHLQSMIVLRGGGESQKLPALALRRWQWPSNEDVQKQFQELAMQLIVNPKEHLHEVSREFSVEAISTALIQGVSLELPQEIQPILLVSYAPKQTWYQTEKGANRIEF